MPAGRAGCPVPAEHRGFMDAKNCGGTDPSQNGDPVLVWDCYSPTLPDGRHRDAPQNCNWT